jgi:OOP family OmpA-OmpF porin
LWAAALWSTTAPLERELAARAGQALEGNVLDQTRLAVSGRDLTFAAAAFSREGRLSAVAALEAVPGIRLVTDESRLVPEARPFVWTIERDVVRVTLGGNAPLPAIKGRLAETARTALGDIEIADHMGLARGAPPRFDAAATLLIEQVARLKEARISLSDTAVKLAGVARELGGREAIAAALKSLPPGYSVAANVIQAPPYIFQANKDPVADTVTLTGNVPDDTAKAAIVAAAGRKFFSGKVADQLKTSIGAAAGFVAAALPALEALSRLSTGSLVFTDREVTLTGDALYAAAVTDIRTHLLLHLPRDWRAKTDITVRPPAGPVDATVCQDLLSQLTGKATIRFETGDAAIDRDSAGLLDRVVETAMRCPSAPIDVIGHADAEGEEPANQLLSERRAQAVADYLVAAGLPSERLTVLGAGSLRPVAPNGTAEGRAQNRRIEFVVRER